MDPVALIVAALAAGAVAGAENTATEAVKDAYAGLKGLVRHRLAGRESGEAALSRHEEEPEQAGKVLEAELVAAGASADPVLLEAARRLLVEVDPAGDRAGKYTVDLRGAQGSQVGNHNIQTNTFSAPPSSAP
ncbi:hypothetical protein [Pseudonocardia alaniniphila]|uniref:RHIM domain-containing protein n=1 Tax=Pseudonocardia alaniniphila TaxID=75291 RepID=A0ABS9TUW5_9PSEU|nr:hypothetical protein [Pseudonocardia alaniniphila]MCH6172352.1 hypothetical protein [Pseudonocardia alaniniphila]